MQVSINKGEALGASVSLKVDKSPGEDGVYPRLVWEARAEIAVALDEIVKPLPARNVTGEQQMWIPFQEGQQGKAG